MKVIIGTDCLRTPLTGVGRYTYELCRALVASEQIDNLEGFDFGRFHSMQERLQQIAHEACAPEQQDQVARGRTLRARLAESRLATALFQAYATRVCGLLLQRKADAVFHSPNFHLPRYDGNSIVTVHDLSYLLYPDFHPAARVDWMQRLVPEALERSKQVICVSHSTRAALLEQYAVAADKVSVTHLGVDPVFRPRTAPETAAQLKAYDLEAGEYLLCVSTLEPRKNIERLVRAYLRLDKRCRQRHPLVLAGELGWHYQELQAAIADGAGQGVRHLGFVSQQALPALYSGARCAIYPSLYEGFGLPVLEAQASGTPVIASQSSSLPEVASAQALLIDPYDTAALAGALQRAIDDRQWREDCSRAGLEKAADFTWQRCAMETLAIYRKASR